MLVRGQSTSGPREFEAWRVESSCRTRAWFEYLKHLEPRIRIFSAPGGRNLAAAARKRFV